MYGDSTLYSRNVSPVSVALRGNGVGVFSPPPGLGFTTKCRETPAQAWGARRDYGSHTFGLDPRRTPVASLAGVEEMQLDEGDGVESRGDGEVTSVVNVGISVHHPGHPPQATGGAFSQCPTESWPSRPGGGKQGGIQIAGNVIQIHPHLQPQLPSPSSDAGRAADGSFGAGVVTPSAPEIMAANGQTGWLTEFQQQQKTLVLANGGNVGGIARQRQPGSACQHQVSVGLVSGPFSSSLSLFPFSHNLARSPKGQSSPRLARAAVILQPPHTVQLRLGPRRDGPMWTVELSARNGAGPASGPADLQRGQPRLPGASGVLKFSHQCIACFSLL